MLKRVLLWTVLMAVVGTFSCERVGADRSIRGPLPTTEVECYEFVLRHATNPEQGTFLLKTCQSLLEARKREKEEDVSLLVAYGGASGRASLVGGTFRANVYNNSGYDLTELVFEIRLFETQDKEKQYEESLSDKKDAEAVEPDEIRRIRIRRDHPNLTVGEYSAEIASPLKYYNWNIVGGRGTKDPHAESSLDKLLQTLRKSAAEPDSQ